MSSDDRNGGGREAAGEAVQGTAGGGGREAAATEGRCWIRLTRRCNNRCLFCLDSEQQDGSVAPEEEVLARMREGLTGGRTRLILSGGEATLHPKFLHFIEQGRKLGYTWIQVITNGRMFAYQKFARAAIEAGLNEATLSIHGPDPKINDYLTGIEGSFEQSLAGLRNLQRLGVVVSVDIVVNRKNIDHLDRFLRTFMALGVMEFDILYITPFGRGFNEHRKLLFDEPSQVLPGLRPALARARSKGAYLWTNRMPPALLEGFEELIQDPHKIEDEVEGGRDRFTAVVKDRGKPKCHGERCDYCFFSSYCDALMRYRDHLCDGTFPLVRLNCRERLAGPLGAAFERQKPARITLEAGHAGELLAWLDRGLYPEASVTAELTKSLDLSLLLRNDRIDRLTVRTGPALEQVLEALEILEGRISPEVLLNRETRAVINNNRPLTVPSLTFMVAARTSLNESRAHDPSVQELKELSARGALFRDLPSCLAGNKPVLPHDGDSLDTGFLDDEGDLDPLKFVPHYIRRDYRLHSARCPHCILYETCRGPAITYIRNIGFAALRPLRKVL